MTYAYDRLFSVIVDAVQADGEVDERMAMVVAECESQHPHRDWERFKTLNFGADAGALSSWLQSALAGPDLAEHNFAGLWFGLTNPVRDSVTTADIYASATIDYAPGSLDWAVSLSYNPERSYLRSAVLNWIYGLAYGEDRALGNDAEYPLALAYGAIVSSDALNQFHPVGPFSSLRGAACGFDSGDFIFLGELKNGRFCKQTVAG